ncbi:MAG TPA: amidohydrolase family protein [Bryobacteraceae bacterium]|nr:amidohydrolase family protein [Bryobacteraceae bacterium]
MRIDAHQHFWDVDRFEYAWMPPEPSPLRQSFLPDLLHRILKRSRFEGTILVQANTLPAETRWLLELAEAHAFIRGVVGWVDLTDPRLGAVLDELQKRPKFVGVRHPVQDEPDDNWLVREDVLGGLAELARRGLPYDLLLRPRHLPLVPRVAARVPDLRMVIDHIAKPAIAAGVMDPWARDIERAAFLPQVYCKLSGMITEADPVNWKADDLRPYVAHVLRVFGPDRLMFGSDWPVCTTAGTWKQVLAAFTQAIGPQPIEIREKLLGGTAARFYGIETA